MTGNTAFILSLQTYILFVTGLDSGVFYFIIVQM